MPGWGPFLKNNTKQPSKKLSCISLELISSSWIMYLDPDLHLLLHSCHFADLYPEWLRDGLWSLYQYVHPDTSSLNHRRRIPCLKKKKLCWRGNIISDNIRLLLFFLIKCKCDTFGHIPNLNSCHDHPCARNPFPLGFFLLANHTVDLLHKRFDSLHLQNSWMYI